MAIDLEARKKGIGGSDIGSILGANPYKSKRDLALEKLGLLPDQEVTPAMERGTRLESMVADLFTEKTGIEVREENGMIVHPEHDWMIGNIDRYTYPDLAVVEIKCPGMAVFSKIRREGLPPAWIAQLQWYLSILGEENGIFVVFNSELWKMEHFQVKADKELQDLMIAEAAKFWAMLQAGEIPEDDSQVIDLPPSGDSKVLQISSPEWQNAVQELCEAKEILTEAQEVEEAAKTEILRLMGDYPIAESDGFRVYNQLQNGRTSFNAKQFQKDHPDLYAKYAKRGAPFKTFKSYFTKGTNQ